MLSNYTTGADISSGIYKSYYKMKNNLEKATFRVLVYKKNQKYILICYETGWVEEYNTFVEAQGRLRNGIIALLKTIAAGKLDLSVINAKPPFLYRFVFYYHALHSILRTSTASFSTEPFFPRTLVNA